MAKTLSCFIDESGQEKRAGFDAKYYLLTLVLHDQDKPISDFIAAYEQDLVAQSLPDIPFHMVDLLHGHGEYENIDFATRKKLYSRFAGFIRRLPIRYKTFAYKRAEFKDAFTLSARMRRDLVEFIFNNLEDFHAFDTIAVYYDGGQKSVLSAVRGAFDYALSSNTAEYKKLRYQERRLAQAADFFCSMELAARKYADKNESSTYLKMYGSRRAFNANHLKQVRRMSIVE